MASGSSAYATILNSTAAYPLQLATNNAERMTITSTGNVGIGTSVPQFTLALPQDSKVGWNDAGSAKRGSITVNSSADAMVFATGTSDTERMRITSGGYTLIGASTNAGFGSVHRISTTTAQGNYVLSIDGGTGQDFSTLFLSVSGGNISGTLAAQWVGRNTSTLRSINAGGTINAVGTDYAEYMTKAIEDDIAKGDIVGIDENGLLTNIFADSKSFVIKSTNPSYVGGDTWGVKLEGEELEAARAKVDRIAFSGQVPCNVYNAQVGDYIIPINDNGKISGQAVTNPTFEQYQISVGKVWKIMEDGRSWIAVKIG
jgi:hypothetical protein